MTVLAVSTWLEGILEEARNPWEIVLLVGQLTFFSRFLVQWIATERRKVVVIPIAFWWLSLLGAAISLVALMAKHEPVLIVAQIVGLGLYSRNLVIHKRSLKVGTS